jgi:hypothetical protein
MVCITATNGSPRDSSLLVILLRVAGTPPPEESLVGSFDLDPGSAIEGCTRGRVSVPRFNSTSVTDIAQIPSKTEFLIGTGRVGDVPCL